MQTFYRNYWFDSQAEAQDVIDDTFRDTSMYEALFVDTSNWTDEQRDNCEGLPNDAGGWRILQVFERCGGCGRTKADVTQTAYRIDHSKREELCPECKERLEQEDIDKYTSVALTNLCDVVNSKNNKDLAESMMRSISRQHRYLQSELFMALWEFFKLYGDLPEGQYDARNEWAVKAAKRWHKETF